MLLKLKEEKWTRDNIKHYSKYYENLDKKSFGPNFNFEDDEINYIYKFLKNLTHGKEMFFRGTNSIRFYFKDRAHGIDDGRYKLSNGYWDIDNISIEL